MIFADVVGTCDGEEFFNESNYDLTAGDVRIKGIRLEGFGDKVKGKKVGDSIKVKADIPDDFDSIELRGKKAEFQVTIQEAKRLEIPKIDAEFLEGTGFESEEDIKQAIRDSLEQRLDQQINEEMHEQLGDYLVANTTLDLPEGLSNRQVERSLERRRVKLMQQGIPPTEADKMISEMEDKAKDQVVKDLKLHFILEKIAEEKKIDVRDEQFNAAIAEIAARSNKRFDRVRDELSQSGGLQHLYVQLRDAAVLQDLMDKANVSEGTATTVEKKSTKKDSEKKSAGKKTAKKATKNASASKSETKGEKSTGKAAKKTTKKKAAKKKS